MRDFHLESLQRRFKEAVALVVALQHKGSLQSSLQDMESLRDLKLQLCRWRLEYQDAYHRGREGGPVGFGCASTLRGCADDGGVAADARQLQQRFDVARLAVDRGLGRDGGREAQLGPLRSGGWFDNSGGRRSFRLRRLTTFFARQSRPVCQCPDAFHFLFQSLRRASAKASPAASSSALKDRG